MKKILIIICAVFLVILASGCTDGEWCPEGTVCVEGPSTTVMVCEYNVPINLLHVRVTNDLGIPLENAMVEVYEGTPTIILHEPRTPLRADKTNIDGVVTFKYSFLPYSAITFLVHHNETMPVIVISGVPCLGADYLINLTNTTIGLEYHYPDFMLYRKGYPMIKIYDRWYGRDELPEIKFYGYAGTFIIQLFSVDGFLDDPILYSDLHDGKIKITGMDIISRGGISARNRIKTNEQSELYIEVYTCKNGTIGELCLDDDLKREYIWIDGDYQRKDREPYCVPIIQECKPDIEITMTLWDEPKPKCHIIGVSQGEEIDFYVDFIENEHDTGGKCNISYDKMYPLGPGVHPYENDTYMVCIIEEGIEDDCLDHPTCPECSMRVSGGGGGGESI